MKISESVLPGEIGLCSDDNRHLGTLRGVCSVEAVETAYQKIYGTIGLLSLKDKDGERIAYLWVDVDCWRKYK